MVVLQLVQQRLRDHLTVAASVANCWANPYPAASICANSAVDICRPATLVRESTDSCDCGTSICAPSCESLIVNRRIVMIIDDNDKLFPIAIRNRYEILRRMFVLEGRQRRSRCYTILYTIRLVRMPFTLRLRASAGNEVKLISARPGNLTAFALLWFKTRRLGRFLKKT